MRKLAWSHARAWIARHPDEWPAAVDWDEMPAEAPRTLALPASILAPEAAVAVELKFQTGGGSFFARLGGHLTPGGGSELTVTIRAPSGRWEESPPLVDPVIAGLELLPERPIGRLELSWFATHPVDSTAWAWRRCAAAMCRLMLPDVADMPDELAALTASEAGDRVKDANPHIVIWPDPADLARDAAAADVRAIAAATIAERGRFRIALAGGSTPRAVYPHLVDGIDWTRTDVFFGDERAVPPDDPQSNYRMARETLLDPARVPEANVHRWRAEAADLDGAARDYEQALRARGEPPWLDLALLGLGPDGHTASLFPGTAALAVEDRLAVSVDIPALGTRRLTLTYPALLGATHVMFLVTGREKKAALAEALRPGSTLPAARILQRAARVRILCDVEAARDITSNP